MKKAFRKNLLREIKNSKSRFLSILIIVAIGTAFFAGVRATSPDMELTCDKYLRDNNFADLTLFSSKGFVEEDIDKIKKIQGVSEAIQGYNFDALAVKGEEEKPVKVHSFNIENQKVNKPVLVEGSLPKNEEECVTEKRYLENERLKLGDSIELKTSYGVKRFKIVGMVNSPLYIDSYERGSNSLGNGKTIAFFQIGEKSCAELSIPPISGVDKNKIYNEVCVIIEGSKNKNIFHEEYKDIVEPVKDSIIELGKERNLEGWYVLDAYNNSGITGFKNNAERIGAIGKVFPLFFFIIAALVCLTGMTRMVDEQRAQIGTLKALGYSKGSIISEYFLYAFTSSIIGSVIGVLIGFKLFPTVIFNAYRIMYSLPKVISSFNIYLAITSTFAAVLCTTVAAVLACIKELISVPAELMRLKAPKAGKRIFLERIEFVWKNMSFIGKVTARNILRYKKRFFMTVCGIAGCTALLLTGFGLKNSILSITDRQFNVIYNYDMIVFLRNPIEKSAIDGFKTELKHYKDINSSMVLLEQSVSVNKSNNDKSEKDNKTANDKDISNIYLIVPEDRNLIEEFIHLGKKNKNIKLSNKGVVITEKLSKLLKVKQGDKIEIKLGKKTVEVKITDIAEQYVGHYIYLSPEYYEEIFKDTVKYNGFQAKIKNVDKDSENKLSTELIKNKNINLVEFTTNINDTFKKNMEGMDSVIWILIISAALLAFVVMFNLTSININERIRELATIKVLGFYDSEVAGYIYRENFILSIIGTIFGLFLGLVMHRYVLVTSEIEMIMFVRTIKPISFVYSAALTIIFAGFVNVVMYNRLKNIDMVEALKSAE